MGLAENRGLHLEGEKMDKMAIHISGHKRVRDIREVNTITLKHSVKLVMQHHMNSLHVYSFMCRLKVSRGRAMKIAKAYEQVAHIFLYY
jgi:hypothetical protein